MSVLTDPSFSYLSCMGVCSIIAYAMYVIRGKYVEVNARKDIKSEILGRLHGFKFDQALVHSTLSDKYKAAGYNMHEFNAYLNGIEKTIEEIKNMKEND